MKGDRNNEKQFEKKPLIQGINKTQKDGETSPKRRKNQCKIEELSYLSQREESSNSIIRHSNSAELQVPEEIIDFDSEKIIKNSIKQQPLHNFPILGNEPMVNAQMEQQHARQLRVQQKDPKFQTGAMQKKKKEQKPLYFSHQQKQSQPKAPTKILYQGFQHIPLYSNPPNPPKQGEDSSDSMADVSQISQKMEQQFSEFQNISVENIVKDPIKFCKGLRKTLKQLYKGFYLTRSKVKSLNSRAKKIEFRKQIETKSQPLEKGIKKQRKRRRASQIERRFKCQYAKCQKGYGSSSSLSNHIHKKHKHEFLSKMKNDKKQSRLLQPEIIDLSKRNENEEEVDSFDNKPDNRVPRHYKQYRQYRYPPADINDEIFEE